MIPSIFHRLFFQIMPRRIMEPRKQKAGCAVDFECLVLTCAINRYHIRNLTKPFSAGPGSGRCH